MPNIETAAHIVVKCVSKKWHLHNCSLRSVWDIPIVVVSCVVDGSAAVGCSVVGEPAVVGGWASSSMGLAEKFQSNEECFRTSVYWIRRLENGNWHAQAHCLMPKFLSQYVLIGLSLPIDFNITDGFVMWSWPIDHFTLKSTLDLVTPLEWRSQLPSPGQWGGGGGCLWNINFPPITFLELTRAVWSTKEPHAEVIRFLVSL